MIDKNHKFIFTVPIYNATSTLKQMIMSVVGQTYTNWKLVMLDVSDINHKIEQRKIVKSILSAFPEYSNQIIYIENKNLCLEIINVLYMIKNFAADDDIICRLDGDDWLTDLDTLYIINQRYNQYNIDALWTAHRWGFSDMNISGRLPECENPYEYKWVSSHLKTFKKMLLNNVPINNFFGKDNSFVKRIGDQALYLPALWNSNKKWYFEPRVCYHYTIDLNPKTFQTETAKFQKEEAEYYRSRGYINEGESWESYFDKNIDSTQFEIWKG